MTVIAMPTPVRTLHEECEHLFVSYPAAVEPGRSSRSMLLRDAGGSRYYVLIQDTADGGQCHLWPWRSQDHPPACITAGADHDRDVPDAQAAVIRTGVPIPQEGSLFGWIRNGAITAIMPVYVETTGYRPQPSFAVLPHERHRTPGMWPPFVWNPVIGREWWDAYLSGQLVSLGPVIAGTLGNVHWVEWPGRREAGHCMVLNDVPADRFTLPAGRYADWRYVETGMRGIPSLDDGLRGYKITDLAGCF